MSCITLAPCREQVSALNLSVRFFETAAALPASVWQRLMPERPHLSASYFSALEQLMTGNMQFRYALIYRQGETIGLCCFQIVTFRGRQLLSYLPEPAEGFVKKLAQQPVVWLAKSVLPLLNWRIAVSGNLFMTGDNGLHFLTDVSDGERAEAVNMAVKQLYRDERTITAFLMPDNYYPKGDFDAAFMQKGYAPIFEESDMNMRLEPAWQGFDDYLAALSSKYRVRARKVMQLSAEVKQRSLNVSDLQQLEERMYHLYHSVMDNASFQLATLPRGFFVQQKALFEKHYDVYGYFLNGELIAFISAYRNDNGVEVHYTGMEYPLCKTLHVYQRMLYDIIALGIAHRIPRLHFGRTAPEIKSTVGAVERPMYGYVHHRLWPVHQFIIKPLAARLKPKQYTLRSPFRS